MIRRSTLRAQITTALRDEILAGRLPPGNEFTVKEIAEQYGVSATPVREALVDLAGQGLLDVEQHRGYRVHEFSRQDYLDMCEARTLVVDGVLQRFPWALEPSPAQQRTSVARTTALPDPIAHPEATTSNEDRVPPGAPARGAASEQPASLAHRAGHNAEAESSTRAAPGACADAPALSSTGPCPSAADEGTPLPGASNSARESASPSDDAPTPHPQQGIGGTSAAHGGTDHSAGFGRPNPPLTGDASAVDDSPQEGKACHDAGEAAAPHHPSAPTVPDDAEQTIVPAAHPARPSTTASASGTATPRERAPDEASRAATESTAIPPDPSASADELGLITRYSGDQTLVSIRRRAEAAGRAARAGDLDVLIAYDLRFWRELGGVLTNSYVCDFLDRLRVQCWAYVVPHLRQQEQLAGQLWDRHGILVEAVERGDAVESRRVVGEYNAHALQLASPTAD